MHVVDNCQLGKIELTHYQPCNHDKLIETCKRLNLMYGNQDVELWRELDRLLTEINLAPALAG